MLVSEQTSPTLQPSAHVSTQAPAAFTSASQDVYGPTCQENYPPASAFVDLSDDSDDSEQYSYSEPDEGEPSDSGDKHEITEDMNYQETVRSVRSFMGWNHIPVFEADLVNWTRATIPGRVMFLNVLPVFQSQCHQTTGCARNWKD